MIDKIQAVDKRLRIAAEAVMKAVDATIQAQGRDDTIKQLTVAKQEFDAACEEARQIMSEMDEQMSKAAEQALQQIVAMMGGAPMGATSS